MKRKGGPSPGNMDIPANRDPRFFDLGPDRADGAIAKFDDLPAQYHQNINNEPPFGGKPGDAPALSKAEIDDIAAVLETLTDRFASPSREAAGC